MNTHEVTVKKTDYRFKILYAFAIIMVVCGHASGGGVTLLPDVFPVYSYHLYLFVFASGYFYRKEEEAHAGRYILKKAKTLLLPMLIYNVIYGIIAQMLKTKGFTMGCEIDFKSLFIYPFTNGSHFEYNLGVWFVSPLFMILAVNVLFRKLAGCFKKGIPEAVFFILSILLGILGNRLSILGYRTGWWLPLIRVLHFLPFFGLGIFYKAVLEKYDKKIPSFRYLAVVLAAKVLLIVLLGKSPEYYQAECANLTEGPLVPVIVGYLGIAFWFRIAAILEPAIGKSKWISLVADNTYSIMVNHMFGFMLVKTAFAFISLYIRKIHSFDWGAYKSQIYYVYQPKGLAATQIIYVVAGIVFSILVQKGIDFCKKKIGQLRAAKRMAA